MYVHAGYFVFPFPFLLFLSTFVCGGFPWRFAKSHPPPLFFYVLCLCSRFLLGGYHKVYITHFIGK